MDGLYVFLILALFALAWGFVRLCDALGKE
jgi:hypothetical protein